MSEEIFFSIYNDKLKDEIIIKNQHFGDVKICYQIYEFSKISTLRYKILDYDEVYEIDYDYLKVYKLSLDIYFQNVLELIRVQIDDFNNNPEFKSKIDDDGIKFIKYFEKIYNDFHTLKK